MKFNNIDLEITNKLDWEHVSRYCELSEEFIRKFHHKVDWYYISAFQKLSEDFIREFRFKVN